MSTRNEDWIDALRVAAEAAGGQEWVQPATDPRRIIASDGRPCAAVIGGGHENPYSKTELAAIGRHISAANPAAIIALIARLRKAEARRESGEKSDLQFGAEMRDSALALVRAFNFKQAALKACAHIETGAAIDNDKNESLYKQGIAKGARDCAYAIGRIQELNAKLAQQDVADHIPDAEKMMAQSEAPMLAVLEGWKLVPLEPTSEICQAGAECGKNQAWSYASCYRTMIAAAPSPQTLVVRSEK